MGFDLVIAVAQHLLPSRRIDDGIGLEIPVPDALLRSRERQRQAFLALAQGLFGSLFLGDVEMGSDDPHQPAVLLPADRETASEDGDVMPVLVTELEFTLVGALAAFDRLVQRFRARFCHRGAATAPTY